VILSCALKFSKIVEDDCLKELKKEISSIPQLDASLHLEVFQVTRSSR
jgi:hypothetical protein